MILSSFTLTDSGGLVEMIPQNFWTDGWRWCCQQLWRDSTFLNDLFRSSLCCLRVCCWTSELVHHSEGQCHPRICLPSLLVPWFALQLTFVYAFDNSMSSSGVNEVKQLFLSFNLPCILDHRIPRIMRSFLPHILDHRIPRIMRSFLADFLTFMFLAS